jgi:hypothetical protein
MPDRLGDPPLAIAAWAQPLRHRARTRNERNFRASSPQRSGHEPCSARVVSAPSAPACAARQYAYERRRPESTTLHRVVRENLLTLYAAVEQGFASVLPAFVRDELEGYVACGVLSRGFAVFACPSCQERKLVAFSCGGRGFCPSCTGRRMAQGAAI